MTAITFENTNTIPSVVETEQLHEGQFTIMLLMLLAASTLVVFLGLFTNPVLTIVAGLATAIITPLLVINHIVKGMN